MATTTAVTLPVTGNLAQRLAEWRTRLGEDPNILYLPTLQDTSGVEWIRVGRAHHLRLKSDTAQNAVLTTVGIIDSNDFYAQADACYRGPTSITKAFYAAKQTMALKTAVDAPFAAEHMPALHNLEAILKMVVSPTFSKIAGVLMSESRFKLRNVLFTRISEPVISNEVDVSQPKANDLDKTVSEANDSNTNTSKNDTNAGASESDKKATASKSDTIRSSSKNTTDSNTTVTNAANTKDAPKGEKKSTAAPKTAIDPAEAAVQAVQTPEMEELGPFNIENWPVRSEAVKAELAEMIGRWEVQPLPAYDMHGHLIEPDFYERRLEDALVAVHFNLVHYAIENKAAGTGTDVYCADIVNIRVLSPPKPTLVTPKRHRIHSVDPMAPSKPSTPKKRRTDLYRD